MDFDALILSFRNDRKGHKKKQFSVTLEASKMARIYEAFGEKSKFFAMLGESEKLDFAIYVLEKFMESSETFNLLPKTNEN